jgi:hypothetical protein
MTSAVVIANVLMDMAVSLLCSSLARTVKATVMFVPANQGRTQASRARAR